MNAAGIPTNWRVVTRETDGERVGYLQRAGRTLWRPRNLIGATLGDPMSNSKASVLLEANGLASLDGIWYCRAPQPLPGSDVDLRSPDPHWPWRAMLLVEVNESVVTLRPSIVWPAETSAILTLTLPADDVLRSSVPPV